MNYQQTFFTKAVNLGDGQNRPRLALTLGDPAGIGPEVVLKAIADPEITLNCDITVIGSRTLLQKVYADLYGESLIPTGWSILDVPLEREIEADIKTGIGNAASGAASFAYMQTAIARTLAGSFDAIVTAPIAKSAWKAAGYDYPGQTELLAQTASVDRFGMLFVARSPHTGWTLRALLATTHIPLCQVSDALTPQLMTRKLDLLVECLEQDFGIETPRIAVAGLNPHSGEQGQLGHEEIDWLIPWLEEQRKSRPHIIIDGPIPPDTMWVKPGRAWFGSRGVGAQGRSGGFDSQSLTETNNTATPANFQGVADGYLALYHDQGLIPVKLMAFDRAVNTTIGLPFIRTSPDHGTAFDIAGKGIADATSMKAALLLAVELAERKIKQNRH